MTTEGAGNQSPQEMLLEVREVVARAKGGDRTVLPHLRALLDDIVNGTEAARTIALDDVVSRLHLNGSSPVPRGATLKAARAQFEREYITAALEDSHGRISAAAEALGLRRTNLYRKIRSLRISEGSLFRS